MYLKKTFICCCLIFMAYAAQAAVLPGSLMLQQQDSLVLQKINRIADEVGKSIAPDKRTVVFKFQLKEGSQQEGELESTSTAAAAETLQKAFQTAGLQVKVQSKLLPVTELGTQIYGVVSLSVANNRKVPGHSAELVTQMLMGTPVELLKMERGYYLVRSPDQYISWVDDDAIAVMDAAQFDHWKKANKLVYHADYGYSYSAPDVSSLRVSDLVKGDIFKVLGKEKGFYKIAYPDQRIAFIPVKDAVEFDRWISRPNPDATAILNTAKTLMGVPYLWGGTSVKGVDCSGFTKTSFFLNGIILPRDASQQVLVGEAVDIYESDTVSLARSLKNLQPGDLLFFAAAKGKQPNPRITHVGIYMSNGQFIQSAGMVRINSLDPAAVDYDGVHARNLVSARRMLNGIGTPEITRIDQHKLYNAKVNKPGAQK
ncbi:NlpC/P60 family protein [Pedobacter immunditicola]|uniref:C40 family peptidase n=1 Tax=Pedobacter immunditicola TaxID=3133440 RepID=UPI0030B0D5B9